MPHLGRPCVRVEEGWFRDVDSNHDTQLQRLMSYRLDDPGIDFRIVAERRKCLQELAFVSKRGGAPGVWET
jgi:hypothetical protein